MPMPTTSPAWIAVRSTRSSVSSTRWGSPHFVPVAAASTYSHRGVMTATPNEWSLGLIRCTRDRNGISKLHHLSLSYLALSDDCRLVRALDSGPASTHQLRRTERGHDDEFERANAW